MTAPNRTYTQVGENGYAQATELYMTDNIRGPGAPTTFTVGDPNGVLSGSAGQLAIDRDTGNVYQNVDDAMAWVLFATGGGGGSTVTTAAPLTGDGSPGSPVTYEDVLGQCLIGNPDEAVLAKPVALTTDAAGGMLANKVPVSVDANYGSGTGVTADPIKVKGAYLGRQVFTASGVYAPNPLAKMVVLTVTGGGGGGGGADATGAGNVSAGGGGGSGVTLQATFANAGGIVGGAVVIGAAGVGGAGATPGNNGTAGGDSSITVNGTTYTAKGGGGGPGGPVIAAGVWATASGAAGSTGASTLAADWRQSNPGEIGIAITTVTERGGNGGSSMVGEAGRGGSGNSPGGAAGKGAGGGGAGAGNAINAGGNGGAGLVYVDEYT